MRRERAGGDRQKGTPIKGREVSWKLRRVSFRKCGGSDQQKII